MKKLIALGLALLLTMTMLCSCGKAGVKIDEKHFPDNSFRGYVLKEFDINGDRYLDEEEISVITKIGCWGEYIKTLKGIEYFTSLEELYCGNNEFTELDVSKCTQLRVLHCDYNQLSTLDLSNCTQLSDLDCSYNQLTSLDVRERSFLADLGCGYNQLTLLDLSGCTSLRYLYCHGNELTSLDVSDCYEYIEVVTDDDVKITYNPARWS